MGAAGMCSSIEMNYDGHEMRTLKWERILKQPRNGNVMEFVPAECIPYLMAKLDEEINLVQEERFSESSV